MSRIVTFRENVMAYLRDSFPDLQEVDWYEGLFSFDDVKEWSLKTPCAWVSVTNIPTGHHTTGELNADLRVVVAVIDADVRTPREADTRVWELLEGIAVNARFNTFGDSNAAPATNVKFLRISDDEIRASGISIGVVEWHSGLTIGDNVSKRRDELWINDRKVDAGMPSTLAGRGRVRDGDREVMPLDGEGYQGDSVLDRGVAEWPMVPAQRWEPDR